MIVMFKYNYDNYAANLNPEELAAFSNVYCKFKKCVNSYEDPKNDTIAVYNESISVGLGIFPGTITVVEREVEKENE